jgi:hypothetical protein
MRIVLACIVDSENVWVVESGNNLHFAFETLAGCGSWEVVTQNLERDRAAEPAVSGSIDNPHAANPEQRFD